MKQRLMSVAMMAVLFVTSACTAGSANRNVKLSPVDTGIGSLEATRRALEGTWSLVSLEVVGPGGVSRPVKATGQLTYDAFGNMKIKGTIDDPALRSTLVLDYDGRIVIDTAKHEFRPADLASAQFVEPTQIAPVSPDKVRRYELTLDSFVVTYVDAASAPTAVARWRRQ